MCNPVLIYAEVIMAFQKRTEFENTKVSDICSCNASWLTAAYWEL